MPNSPLFDPVENFQDDLPAYMQHAHFRGRYRSITDYFSPLDENTEECYHSTIGQMNPSKLRGIMDHGILSHTASERFFGKNLCPNIARGNGVNGLYNVSVALKNEVLPQNNGGAFCFVIDANALREQIKVNPVNNKEGVVKGMVPPSAIKAIMIGDEEANLDISSDKIKIVGHTTCIGILIKDYIEFMEESLNYMVPKSHRDKLYELANNEKNDETIRKIETIIKGNLKAAYQNKLGVEKITMLQIARYHAPATKIINKSGKELIAEQTAKISASAAGKSSAARAIDTTLFAEYDFAGEITRAKASPPRSEPDDNTASAKAEITESKSSDDTSSATATSPDNKPSTNTARTTTSSSLFSEHGAANNDSPQVTKRR